MASVYATHRKTMRAAIGHTLGADIGEEILRLIGEIRRAEHARSTPVKVDLSPIEQAHALIKEVDAVCEFSARFGADPDLPRVLARVRRECPRASRDPAVLALSVDAYVGLAEHYAKHLEGLGGFTRKQLGDADALRKALHAVASAKQDNPLAAQHATRERNLLVIELQARVRDLRAAARFVFRHEPEVIRAFTSAYGRRRRRASRAKKRAAPPPT